MQQQNKAYLYAGTAVLMWSTVGSAFKLTLRYLDPLHMLLFASFISILVLLVIMIVQGKWHLVKISTGKDILYSAILGLLNPCLFYIVLFNAYDILLTQEAMVLNFTWPVTLTILSILFLKQKIGWKSLLAIFISFIGIIIIATNGKIGIMKFTSPAGVTLALGSTVIWSLFWIFNIKDKRDEVVKLLLNFLFGFIYILIIVVITEKQGVFAFEHGPWSLKPLAGVFYIGLFEMGIAYVSWLKGLQLSVTTAKVSSLIFFAPFISLVIINLAVGEAIHWSTLAGLVFIVGGIVLQRIEN